MKTIYVKYWDPSEVMGRTVDTLPKSKVMRYCFRAAKYNTEAEALWAYTSTMYTWSTLLEQGADVEQFVEEAYEALKEHNYDWLEENFT
jgi:hypothetical protein